MLIVDANNRVYVLNRVFTYRLEYTENFSIQMIPIKVSADKNSNHYYKSNFVKILFVIHNYQILCNLDKHSGGDVKYSLRF